LQVDGGCRLVAESVDGLIHATRRGPSTIRRIAWNGV